LGAKDQRFVDLPGLTLRLDAALMLLRAAGVREAQVILLTSYANDMAKYSADSPDLREEVDRVMKAFFSALDRDCAVAAGAPLSAAPVILRGGPTLEA
jgi:enamine deaminase RidA (YjgF/YER057c/UK114 family)